MLRSTPEGEVPDGASPHQLYAGNGYDCSHLRRRLSEQGIRHRMARKGAGPPNGSGGTAGPSNARWPGSLHAVDSIAATSAKLSVSSPSRASHAP
ncbi:hypothetical protein GCM10010421_22430 [Streptomyces glaucus]|uniref:Transposase IS4-like domain-containing protein n=1 Tax=Streptomyces glaucus TaxID=284029 RepID=A0ABN3JN19_9ACTN